MWKILHLKFGNFIEDCRGVLQILILYMDYGVSNRDGYLPSELLF